MYTEILLHSNVHFIPISMALIQLHFFLFYKMILEQEGEKRKKEGKAKFNGAV